MKYNKKVLANMNKCYAIAMFSGSDQDSFLIATEKTGPCRRFALDGTPLETVWEGPGGVMTMLQVPGRKNQFLSTQEFYSPNCGGEDARIVTCTKQPDKSWKVDTLCDLPYVHRFGLLKASNGQHWLLACTIKGSCEYKEDWRSPGTVYAALLPEDLSAFNKNNQLKLTVLLDGQFKNHGYFTAQNQQYALISTQSGVYQFVPPAKDGGEWAINCLLEQPVSDITQVDFDGDGRLELLTISPFHGDELSISQIGEDGKYHPVYQFPIQLPFLHAVWGGRLNGEPCAIIGHRKGERDLLRVYYDREKKEYQLEKIDHDCGSANVLVYSYQSKDYIIAANREVNEVALYMAED